MVCSKIPIIPTNFSFLRRAPPRSPKNPLQQFPLFISFCSNWQIQMWTHPNDILTQSNNFWNISLTICRIVSTSASGHALHQGHLAQRGLDHRRRHRDHCGWQLLRRPAGGVRNYAGLERADHLTRHPGADSAAAHSRRGGGYALLQKQAVLQGIPWTLRLCL